MKAIILAAGYATRLYPLTLHRAKPLIEINNKPIIDYLIEKISELKDVDKIYIVCNQRFFNQFTSWKEERGYDNVEVINDETINEEQKLGSIGDINFVVEKEKIKDDILVMAGDNMFDFSLVDPYKFFKKKKKDVTIVYDVKDLEQAKRGAVIVLDKNNKVIDLKEKPRVAKSTLFGISIYFYTKDSVKLFKKYLDSGNNPDAPGYFLEWLHKVKDVYAYVLDEKYKWFDIGNLDWLNQAREYFKV